MATEPKPGTKDKNKRRRDAELEDAQREARGQDALKSGKANQEGAKRGAMASGDNTAIQQAQGTELPTSPQINVKEANQLLAQQSAENKALRQQYLEATPEEQQNLEQQNPDAGLLSGSVSSAEGLVTDAALLASGGGVVLGGGKIGAKLIGQQAFKKITLPKVSKALTSLGGLVGLGSVYSVYNAFTSGKRKELEGDIGELNSASRTILSDVSQGADPVEALETIRTIEGNIKSSEGEMNQAIRNNFIDRIKGVDTQEFMFKNLNAVVRRRQALERMMLTGNNAEILMLAQAEAQNELSTGSN